MSRVKFVLALYKLRNRALNCFLGRADELNCPLRGVMFAHQLPYLDRDEATIGDRLFVDWELVSIVVRRNLLRVCRHDGTTALIC
jgi:hypothetical protein